MRLCRAVSLLALAVLLTVPSWAAGWADRGEYDLVMSIRSEASPQKRVALLDSWQAKYPASEFLQVRRELYLAAFESLGDGPRMFKTAREMMDAQADNLVGVYWCTLLVPEMQEPSAEILGVGEKAARQLLTGSDKYFNATAKPAAVNDADWKKRQASASLLAHRTLGWIAWQRGDLAGATKEFRSYLDQSPAGGEVTAWLGIVSGLQKEPEKQAASLWYLQRAASLRGAGALADDQRRVASGLADNLYTAYHGESDGLEALKGAAAAAPVPPADFKIETAAAIAARRADEELARTNPQLAAWVHIRRQLESPDREKNLADLRSAPLPKLKGTVIRMQPEDKPTEIVLGFSQPLMEEIVLRVNPAFPNAAPAGTELEFEGATVVSFANEPFTLTVTADHEKITGWPEPPPPPARTKK